MRTILSALAAMMLSLSLPGGGGIGGATASDYRTGAYAGATIGVATGYMTNNSGDLTTNGVPVSGLVGYTMALGGGMVGGIEGEIAWANVKGSQTTNGYTLEASTDYTAALKARLGYAMGPALIYATAGPSWTKGKVELVGLKDDNLTLNVLAGAGVDLQITNTLAFRLEAVRQFSADAQTWTLGTASEKLDAGETTIKIGVIFNLN